MAEIVIAGYKLLVDDEDVKRILEAGPWSIVSDKNKQNKGIFYFGKQIRKEHISHRIYLHRFICGTPENLTTDHINRNTLDNRKENLRSVTQRENNTNRDMGRNDMSNIRCITYHKNRKKWQVKLFNNSKDIYCGMFSELEDAIYCKMVNSLDLIFTEEL